MAGRKRSDELLIAALARSLTQKEAAAYANMSERTVRRRLSDMEFRMAVLDRQRAIAQEADAALIAALPAAVETLTTTLDDAEAPTRLRAAKTILELAQSARDRIELRGDLMFIQLISEEEARLKVAIEEEERTAAAHAKRPKSKPTSEPPPPGG